MKNKTLKGLRPLVQERWGAEKTTQIMARTEARLEDLLAHNAGESRAQKAHTAAKIYPCVALYEALQQEGVTAPEALAFLDESLSRQARPGAQSMARLLDVAGLYRFYPAIFTWVARHQFGEAAGFRAKFYDMGRGRSRFDMTQCLYLDTCRRCGCEELTQCFCHVDDVNNGALPHLCWNRTQYMGGGGKLCDFDIFVTKKK